MFSTFGFWEILIVAAVAFAAYQYYNKVGKFDTIMITLIAVGVYLLFAGVSNSTTDFSA